MPYLLFKPKRATKIRLKDSLHKAFTYLIFLSLFLIDFLQSLFLVPFRLIYFFIGLDESTKATTAAIKLIALIIACPFAETINVKNSINPPFSYTSDST